MHSDTNSVDPAEVAQLMDDHHLVLLGAAGVHRDAFVTALVEHLEAMPDCEVVRLRGDAAGLTAIAAQLGEQLGAGPVPPIVPAILDLLGNNPREPKHQFFVWEDADLLLEADVGLFAALAGGFFRIAAEREFVTPDVLVLQRVAFVGGDKLGAYAEDRDGALRAWRRDDDPPAPRVVTDVLERPPVLTYRLDLPDD